MKKSILSSFALAATLVFSGCTTSDNIQPPPDLEEIWPCVNESLLQNSKQHPTDVFTLDYPRNDTLDTVAICTDKWERHAVLVRTSKGTLHLYAMQAGHPLRQIFAKVTPQKEKPAPK